MFPTGEVSCQSFATYSGACKRREKWKYFRKGPWCHKVSNWAMSRAPYVRERYPRPKVEVTEGTRWVENVRDDSWSRSSKAEKSKSFVLINLTALSCQATMNDDHVSHLSAQPYHFYGHSTLFPYNFLFVRLKYWSFARYPSTPTWLPSLYLTISYQARVQKSKRTTWTLGIPSYRNTRVAMP